MENLDFWRLCDELNIIQASLLIAGEDPSYMQEYVENWDIEKRPTGYEAVKSAIITNILSDKIPASQSWLDYGGLDIVPEYSGLDIRNTIIKVESLKTWLIEKGFASGFFFSNVEANSLEFLNKNHPSYTPKLASAVSAWLAITENPELAKGKTIKQSLIKWLRENSTKFGFTNEEGLPNDNIIEEIAKIANWDTKGGAPKTPSKN